MERRPPRLRKSRHWFAESGELIDWQTPLAVGFSGGGDSTALLLALAERHPRVEAWHIDHGWHASSTKQAALLRERCASWGINIRIRSVVCSRTRNREASARAARLQAFHALAETSGIRQIALAHQRDDQAESVCIRMLQGAGVRGCRGMRARQTLGGLTLLRPLLDQPATALRQALRECGIDWLEDPSNRDERLLRNRVRHRLLPEISRRLADTGGEASATALFLRWQRQAVRLHAAIADACADISLIHQKNAVSIPWQSWQQQPAPIRAELLQRMVAALAGDGTCLGKRHILLAEQWLAHGGNGGIDLSRCRLAHQQEWLCLMRHPPK